MSDIQQTISEQRNWLERIVQRVPGFQGYFDRENRREADKLLRDFGVSRLDEIVSELHDATKNAQLEQMDDLQELVNQVEKLRNELRHADRGYAGFFSEIKWGDASMLEAMYTRDRAIVERVDEIHSTVSSGEFAPEAVRALIRELSRDLADREHAILGLATE